jgi:hypothetical protein
MASFGVMSHAFGELQQGDALLVVLDGIKGTQEPCHLRLRNNFRYKGVEGALPICPDFNSGQDRYNWVLTSSTWITIAPRAQGNFTFTTSTMSPELRISPVPTIRQP